MEIRPVGAESFWKDRRTWRNLTFVGPCFANIFAEYNQQDAAFHSLRQDICCVIHFLVCLTTGPQPLPKPVLHTVRSSASSFNFHYSIFSLKSSSSCLIVFLVFPSFLSFPLSSLDTGFSWTQVFLGFPVSINKCWDGSQDSKLPLHASHVALPT